MTEEPMTEEPMTEEPMTGERFQTEPAVWRSVARGAACGLAIGVVIELIGLAAHNHPSPVLALGMPVACLMLLQLVRASAAELPPPEQAGHQPSATTSEYFVRLRQLERRLESASRDPSNFEWTLRPMLAQLAAERLQHKRGINVRHEPEQAREIVGEQLWQIMITSPDTPDTPIQPVSPTRLRELVQAISRI